MSKNYLNRRNVGYEPIGNSIGGDPRQSRTRRMFDPVSAAISVGGNLLGGALSSNASSSAANKQSKAALQAAQMQQQTASGQIQYMQQLRDQQIRELQQAQQAGVSEAQAGRQGALDYLENLRSNQANLLSSNYNANVGQQQDIYGRSMGNLQPYLQTGAQGATTLAGMIPQLTKSFTAEDLKSNLSPNYEFMKEQGLGALGQSMNVGGGGSNMTRAATKFAEDYASNAYQNAFNNWQQQQNNIYNRLSGISGIGTTASGQGVQAGASTGSNLASLGSNYGQQTNALNLGMGATSAQTGLGYEQLAAQQRLGFGGQMANFNQGMGSNIANLATGGAAAGAAGLTGSAAAQAAGQVGSTNAITGALGNATNTYLLSSLMNPQSTMASPTGGFNSGYDAAMGANFTAPNTYG